MQFQKTKEATDEALRFDLFKIIREGEVRRLEELLESRRSTTEDISELVNINQTRWSGWTPLHRAAELGYTDVIELLLENGAKIGESLMFPHNMTCPASVSLLYNSPLLLDAVTTWGWHTPLHLALGNGFLSTAWFLVENGAVIIILFRELLCLTFRLYIYMNRNTPRKIKRG
jgi:ankyrin repeat protein